MSLSNLGVKLEHFNVIDHDGEFANTSMNNLSLLMNLNYILLEELK